MVRTVTREPKNVTSSSFVSTRTSKLCNESISTELQMVAGKCNALRKQLKGIETKIRSVAMKNICGVGNGVAKTDYPHKCHSCNSDEDAESSEIKETETVQSVNKKHNANRPCSPSNDADIRKLFQKADKRSIPKRRKKKSSSEKSSDVTNEAKVVTLFQNPTALQLAQQPANETSRSTKQPEVVLNSTPTAETNKSTHYRGWLQATKAFEQKSLTHAQAPVSATLMPFIAGTSTSRSHNICLNLQEMLAMMKRRQLVKGLSKDEECEEVEVEVTESSYTESNVEPTKESLPGSTVFSESERTVKFKTVLKCLYEDFTTMAQDHEKLMKAISLKGANQVILKKELKKVDTDLGRKEDQIVVLISMYREVIAMKGRLRQLEECKKTSPTPSKSTLAPVSSHTTNLRMKLLLNQINKFQQQLDRL